jgi:hypothetical protein
MKDEIMNDSKSNLEFVFINSARRSPLPKSECPDFALLIDEASDEVANIISD